MILVNATPHDLHFIRPNGDTVTLTASGIVARAEQDVITVGLVDVDLIDMHVIDVPLVNVTYGNLTGLPAEQAGRYYVVSVLAAQAAKAAGRGDCYIVSDTVRDSGGRIIGCRALAIV